MGTWRSSSAKIGENLVARSGARIAGAPRCLLDSLSPGAPAPDGRGAGVRAFWPKTGPLWLRLCRARRGRERRALPAPHTSEPSLDGWLLREEARGRPRRWRSSRLASRSSKKRFRHWLTTSRRVSRRRAISSLPTCVHFERSAPISRKLTALRTVPGAAARSSRARPRLPAL